MARLESAVGPMSQANVAHQPRGKGMSIGQYLLGRLQDYGIGHVFGIPGDYILNFYAMLEKSPIQAIGCTREDCAGFAADAYARINGMGAVCVTYCVGGLSVCNSIAGAYAEKSPVVVITGSPGLEERVNNPLLHHKVRDFRTQIEVFEKLCVAVAELNDPVVAYREIDRVLATVARYKRPGYIDIPRDMVEIVPHISHAWHQPEEPCDEQAMAEAVEEALTWLGKAKQPVILAGVEMHRFGLQDKVVALAEKLQCPVAATLLGKSVFPEKHPQYIGLYEGSMGHARVTDYVESADCVLVLGAFMTDLNLGIFTAKLDAGKCVYVTSEQLRIRHHHYHGVSLQAFLNSLAARVPAAEKREIPEELRPKSLVYERKPEEPMTSQKVAARLEQQINDQTIIVADVGDSLFASTEITTREQTEFIASAYYTSMGFAVPAALGAQIARPKSRVVVIVGDGAFQMTGMEISTMVRYKFSPIIIVLNNEGYGTERFLHPGDWEFNEIQGWQFHRLLEVFGGGKGYEVRTEKEFDAALTAAWADRSGPSLINVHVPRDDSSAALKRLAERLSKVV